MISLQVKITADGQKAGNFQIEGTAEEQEALWQCLNLIMPAPTAALEKLQPKLSTEGTGLPTSS
jgi:hypothetical protein